MRFRRTVRFKREFQSLPDQIQHAAPAKFALFSRKCRHPSLQMRKLEGVFWHGHQVFDLWVTEKCLVLFVIDHEVVVSFSIGPHSIVSKKRSQVAPGESAGCLPPPRAKLTEACHTKHRW